MLVSRTITTATVVFCCSVLAVSHRAGVERMKIVVEETEHTENRTYTYSRQESPPNEVHVTAGVTFRWSNCGSSSDLLIINGLSVTPDPLRTPGSVSVSFDVTIQETFDAPLKLQVELEKYEGFFWFHVPCIDDVGSCTYADICQKLASINCPQPFIQNNIPCKCPFSKGNYNLPTSAFTLSMSVPGGNYYIQAHLSYGSKAVNCFEAYFGVA